MKKDESLVGGYRVESANQWTAEVALLRKFHHSLMDKLLGSSMGSWLMIGWIFTVLEAGQQGPALKNRLLGDAEMRKELLNRESRRAEDGVKYFTDTLRRHFI